MPLVCFWEGFVLDFVSVFMIYRDCDDTSPGRTLPMSTCRLIPDPVAVRFGVRFITLLARGGRSQGGYRDPDPNHDLS